jgi:hypothetical protein
MLPENREVLANYLVGTLFEELDLDEEHGYFGRVVGLFDIGKRLKRQQEVPWCFHRRFCRWLQEYGWLREWMDSYQCCFNQRETLHRKKTDDNGLHGRGRLGKRN